MCTIGRLMVVVAMVVVMGMVAAQTTQQIV
jgi:hypothetical protein